MTTRRGLLRMLLGGAAAIAVPRLVPAASLMPIYVPKPVPVQEPVASVFGSGDFTVESWIQPNDTGEWRHVAITRDRDHHMTYYVDGMRTTPTDGYVQKLREVLQGPGAWHSGLPALAIDGLRVSHGLAREPAALGYHQTPRTSIDFRAPPLESQLRILTLDKGFL